MPGVANNDHNQRYVATQRGAEEQPGGVKSANENANQMM